MKRGGLKGGPSWKKWGWGGGGGEGRKNPGGGKGSPWGGELRIKRRREEWDRLDSFKVCG